MELIGAEKQLRGVDPSQLILGRIKRALEGLSSQVTLVQTEPRAAFFSLLLKEKKNSDMKLWSHWHITIQQSVEVRISLTDPHQEFLPPDPTINTTDLLLRLNRESIFGTYFMNQEYPLLSFRHTLATQNNNKFVGGAVSEVFWQVSQQFAKWAVKLKLAGGEKCKSGKMHHCLKRIRYMKQFFENERLNRPKSLKVYDLSHSSIKVVEEAMRLISYHTVLLKNHRATEVKKNHSLLQLYTNEYQKLLKEMAPNHQHPPDYIMRGIQINRIIDERKIDEGGYSEIYRGEYIVGVDVTISPYSHKNHTQPIQTQPQPSMSIQNEPPIALQNPPQTSVQQGEWEKQLSRRLLVKKVLKSNVKEDDSFKNEINLLKFIRSEKDPRIAGYFMPAQQQKLYMEYYQHNLMVACQNWSEQQLLTTAKQIVEGVTFLATRKILHRDLKELNILMDTHNHPKIIDFGSSCGVYQQKPTPGAYEAISNALMSTKGYYFSYNNIEADYPHIMKNFTRDQYNRAANFDLFSIGTILRNLFTLARCFDSVFYRELCYLADKCQERNPEDRLTAIQAETYLYLLSELYRLENEEANKVSLRSLKSQKEDSPSELYNTS